MNSARSTLNNALEGHYREAVDSAREDTVNAAKELQNVTDDTAVERSDSMYSAFTHKNK